MSWEKLTKGTLDQAMKELEETIEYAEALPYTVMSEYVLARTLQERNADKEPTIRSVPFANPLPATYNSGYYDGRASKVWVVATCFVDQMSTPYSYVIIDGSGKMMQAGHHQIVMDIPEAQP